MGESLLGGWKLGSKLITWEDESPWLACPLKEEASFPFVEGEPRSFGTGDRGALLGLP